METSSDFLTLAISLGLGLLVGLQRQVGAAHLAGVRTFPLITLTGTIAAMLTPQLGAWVVPSALLGIIAVTVGGHLASVRRGDAEPGITTEIAIIYMFSVGALLVAGPRDVAVVLGAGAAVLLHAKEALHTFAARLGERDMRAIMQFALISLVILPVLPDRPFGPFGTLNPHTVWLFVVLVVGISLLGYLAYKFLGEGTGILAGGILGGMISSTATTVSYARRAKDSPGMSRAATVVIVMACVIVYGRISLEMGVVSPRLLKAAAAPVAILAAVSFVQSLVLYRAVRSQAAELPEQSNPSEMRVALVFGCIYAMVRLASAAAKEYLGVQGLIGVAIVSGMTDMDAITLSTSRMVQEGVLDPDTGWRVVVTAAMSNLCFKAGIVWVLGGRALFMRVAPLFGVSVAVGIGLLLMWPAWTMG